MLFNSLVFILLFLPVTLVVYYQLGQHFGRRAPMVWLTAASLFYYGWWNPSYVPLILFSCICNFAVGRRLMKAQGNRASKTWLTLGVIFNLGLLCYFKYTLFALDVFNVFFSTDYSMVLIVLPLAISFFTFQQIAYLVDVSRREANEYDFADYMLFVCFFPQLIAGPIVHHREMMPQFALSDTFRFEWNRLAVGLSIFALGLAKKVLIADTFGKYASEAFAVIGAGSALYVFEAWIGALAYTFQLYFDFSGYSDMAIGIGWMFGIRLPENFFSPYKASSIVDFWRRWHITLSRFLRDYVYIPLGGNREGELRRNLYLMVTMLLGGLWHGAGWTFVVWGAVHGVCLALSHQWSIRFKINNQGAWKWLGVAITFWVVMSGWVIFRAPDMNVAIDYLLNMYRLPEWLPEGQPGLFKERLLYILLLVVLACLLLPNTQQIFSNYHPAIRSLQIGPEERKKGFQICWQPNLLWATAIVLVLVVCILSLNKHSEFLYYQF